MPNRTHGIEQNMKTLQRNTVLLYTKMEMCTCCCYHLHKEIYFVMPFENYFIVFILFVDVFLSCAIYTGSFL